jgi:patatin-like phospholipase/acyl hydrolase
MILETVTKVYDQIDSSVFIGYHVTNSQNDQVTFVPNNEANSDYQAIQEWAAIEGNTITDNPPE